MATETELLRLGSNPGVSAMVRNVSVDRESGSPAAKIPVRPPKSPQAVSDRNSTLKDDATKPTAAPRASNSRTARRPSSP